MLRRKKLRALGGLLATWAALALSGCQGPEGPAGPMGTPGATGDLGMPGIPGPVPCQGTTQGLAVAIRVAATPAAGFFAAGDSPEILIRFNDRCGNAIKVKDLGTASLYLSGPRLPLLTKTASRLLNCVTDRMAADRQHHFINLLAPKFADPAQNNLSEDADGTLHYRLAPITSEPPGTYGIGVYAKSKDELDQTFPVQDLQIGTATVETYSAGPSTSSSCAACHQGTDSGKLYMHHIIPGFSPVGNFAIDQQPLATCKSCHNQDGYSVNPLVRKVHAVHRGAHQVTPGVAHPEYGLGTDTTLADYLDVGFPSMPDKEKDCTKCHVDSRWLSAPSRLGCGTCHENVFFDSGTITPPRVLGKPAAIACVLDADCGAFGAYGQLAVCNTGTGSCEVRVHPKATDDSQCLTCHSADASGIVPTAAAHEILSRTQVRGLQVQNLTLSGGSGPNGTVLVGDMLTVKFKLTDKAGTLITDLKTNAKLSTTFILGGPTDDRQRVFGATTVAGATLAFDGTFYTYALPTAFPATAQTPLNTTGLMPRPNPPGTYSVWLYVAESLTIAGKSVRDSGSSLIDFRVGADGPVQPRQVILRSACNSCHVTLQAHGGSRRDAQGCSLCHSNGALDRGVGAKGGACTMTSQCGGGAAGWETCQDTNGDGMLDACMMTKDPTPNQTIRFSVLVHDIHYARKREGYSESSNLVLPGKLVIIAGGNGVNDFSEVLFPQDVRNCSKCHADSAATCSTAAPCGIGQECRAGVCRNSAFTQPSTAVCLSCHDSAAATGHAAIMTWSDPSGKPIETCSVCHDPDAEFAVAKVHNISQPYTPPYSRN